jgi:hypothetical protein
VPLATLACGFLKIAGVGDLELKRVCFLELGAVERLDASGNLKEVATVGFCFGLQGLKLWGWGCLIFRIVTKNIQSCAFVFDPRCVRRMRHGYQWHVSKAFCRCYLMRHSISDLECQYDLKIRGVHGPLTHPNYLHMLSVSLALFLAHACTVSPTQSLIQKRSRAFRLCF